MRFIAKYAKYAVQVRPQVVEAYATGATKIIQTQLTAQFTIDLTTPEEKAIARQLWSFNGFYQEEDLVTIREPDYRISAFDTRLAQMEVGWSDEERETVEQALSAIAIRTPGDVLLIEEKRAEPPWPTYDTYNGTRVQFLKKLHEDGYELADVLAYERENQNRDEVVATLEQALEAEPDTTPEREEELVG
jgi:hypothetical protein